MSETGTQADTAATGDADAGRAAIETEAREMGWRPKDQFKGPESAWRDADEFVARGKEILPIVNKRNQALLDEIATLKTSQSATIERLERMNQERIDRAISQVRDEYERKVDKAAELGDTDAVKVARAERDKAMNSLEKEAKESKPKAADDDKAFAGVPEKDRAPLKEWIDDNQWFSDSPKLARKARIIMEDVVEDMPAASTSRRLAEVTKRMEAAFPTEFGLKPKGNGSGRVEGGDRAVEDGGGKSNMASRLRKDGVLDTANADVKKKLYKTVDEWGQMYYGETA